MRKLSPAYTDHYQRQSSRLRTQTTIKDKYTCKVHTCLASQVHALSFDYNLEIGRTASRPFHGERAQQVRFAGSPCHCPARHQLLQEGDGSFQGSYLHSNGTVRHAVVIMSRAKAWTCQVAAAVNRQEYSFYGGCLGILFFHQPCSPGSSFTGANPNLVCTGLQRILKKLQP